jgi:hypothetical protein
VLICGLSDASWLVRIVFHSFIKTERLFSTEMANSQALLMGDSDIDQLYKIFRLGIFLREFFISLLIRINSLNGTPTNADWAEIENLPYYRNNFPKWFALKLEVVVPRLPSQGIDLLQVRFIFSSIIVIALLSELSVN